MKFFKHLLVLALLANGKNPILAQHNWDGDNPLGNFSWCSNWYGDTCPSVFVWNATTDLQFNYRNNPAQVTLYYDAGGTRAVRDIRYMNTFAAGLPFDSNGNRIEFYGKIENQTLGYTQTLNIPLTARHATNIELNPLFGNLVFNQPILNPNNAHYSVYGNNIRRLVLNNYPEGSNAVRLYLRQYSIVEANYNNAASFKGGCVIESGELWVGANAVVQGPIQLGSGTSLTNKIYISHGSTATTVANNITVPLNSPNATIGSLNTSGTHTYSGIIQLTNNDVNVDPYNAGGTLQFTGLISGTGGLRKIGAGLARLSASNNYTGTTMISTGTLQLGAANVIADASTVRLNGGTLSTGNTIGFSDTVGTLALIGNATIALGTGAHNLRFAASNGVVWTGGRTLTITGWGSDCNSGRIFVGNSATALTAAQLAQITFQGFPAGAKLTSTGELIPNSIMITATGGTFLGAYPTVRTAFAAINSGTHSGVMVMTVLDDTTETAAATLNNNPAMTSLLIQPGGCGARTITGNIASNSLIDFGGADWVTMDGLNTNGNSLTLINTSGVANATSTIAFRADATNNTVTNCTVLGACPASTGNNGGNIWFGAGAIATGNDNNTISNCNIGPVSTLAYPNKGIYFTGTQTAGLENDNILITNNNIYDCFTATINNSAAIDVNAGSTGVTITNNRIFQRGVRSNMATAGQTFSGIRIANTAGSGYLVSGNTIGFADAAGTGVSSFTSASNLSFGFVGIEMNVSAAAPSSVQGNTIAGITYDTAPSGNTNGFYGIWVRGGQVHVGDVTGNTIGLPTAPINYSTTTAATSGFFGINATSTSTVPLRIHNNTIQSINYTGIAATNLTFNGILTAGAGAYSIQNNTIGNANPANSIAIGTLGVSTGSAGVRAISTTATGLTTIGGLGTGNTIQNFTINNAANNNFYGIATGNGVASVNISHNTLRGINLASTTNTNSVFYGITTRSFANGITITDNILGDAASGLVSYGAAAGNFWGIEISTGAAIAGNILIRANSLRGINNPFASTTNQHHYINNNVSAPSIEMSDNTFTDLVCNANAVIFLVNTASTLSATGVKTISNNRIVGTFSKPAATGNLVLYYDAGVSFAGASSINTNNDFSNITVFGATIITGWQNVETGFTTKTISGNTFNNWTGGTGTITGVNTNSLGNNSAISNNTLSNWNSTGTFNGINTNNLGTANAVVITNNTITNLAGATAVTGISAGLPVTVLSLNIQGNTVNGLSNTTSNTLYGIRDTSNTTDKTVSDNTVSNLSGMGPTAGLNIGSLGNNTTVANNTITSMETSGATVTGISASSGTTGSMSVTGNLIDGLTNNSGTSSYAYGILTSGTAPMAITNNTVSAVNGAGNGTTAVGIYHSNIGPDSTIENNTISNLNGTNSSATLVRVSGISTGSSTAGGNIFKNRIYGLSNASTATISETIGCSLTGGNWTLANNMISVISNGTAAVYGITETVGTGARRYFYNSIYLGGTSPGASASAAIESYGASEFKNNILYNNRTSTTINRALFLSGLTLVSSDHNLFYSVIPSRAVTFSSSRNLLDWQVFSGQDANSFQNTIAFADVTTADLHIVGICSDLESGGTPVSVADDFDAQSRHATTPDIGADEFSGTLPADITVANASICLGDSVALNAASSDGTYVYTWSPATGLDATTGAIVNASPAVTTTYAVTATSPAGCVTNQFVTVTVHPLPTQITVTPPVVTACLNTTQMFVAGPVSNSALQVGYPNVSTVAANTPYRQGVSTSESRVQYLVTRAELNALGLNTAAKIISLGFNVRTAGTGAMPNFTISIAPTAATSLSATYIATGFTTVYTTTNLTPVGSVNTHIFDTPFDWDGISNLVINICSNGSGGTASVVWGSNFATPMTTSGIATGQCGIATGATDFMRPMILFGFENTITWAPDTELFTDALATEPYVSGTHATTVYAHATTPRLYTATSTSPVGNCIVTATGMFDTAVSTWDGMTWLPAEPTGNTSLVFAGDFSSTDDLSGCSCTVTAGNVLINGPHAVTLTEGLTVNNGIGTSMTFLDTASLLQTNDAAVNFGDIRMERITQPMYRYDYTYWGSPVTLASEFTLGDLSPATQPDKYYSWIPTVSNSFGTWFQETSATDMIPAKGYIVRAPQTYSMDPMVKVAYPGMFTGTPNNGVVTIPILHGSVPSPNYNDDYNLLSNPYPSAVDAEEFLSYLANVPVLDGTIYFWTHNSPVVAANPDPFYGDYIYNYNANDYASWNKLGGTGTTSAAGTGGQAPNGFIAAGQGFFTRSAGAVSGTVATFNNAMRVAGDNDKFFRNANTDSNGLERHRVWLNLTGNSGSFNQILIGYADGATLDWDRSFDGIYFSEGSAIEFYSVIPDHKLVIQGRPLPFTDQDQIPLGFKASASETFSFRIDHFDSLFETQSIYIEDLLLGIIHDLKQSPYVFTTEAGRFDTRFVLRFNDATLQTDDFATNDQLTAFLYNNQLRIASSKEIDSVTVFDISGKRLTVIHPDSNPKSITGHFASANGVYLLRIRYTDGTQTAAKVVH